MIVEFKAPSAYPRASVTVGQTLYAIRVSGLYWIWAYTTQAMAEVILAKFPYGPSDNLDLACNWRKNLSQLIPSDLEAKK